MLSWSFQISCLRFYLEVSAKKWGSLLKFFLCVWLFLLLCNFDRVFSESVRVEWFQWSGSEIFFTCVSLPPPLPPLPLPYFPHPYIPMCPSVCQSFCPCDWFFPDDISWTAQLFLTELGMMVHSSSSHQSLHFKGRLGTTDNFATSSLHFPCSPLPSGTCQTPGLSIPLRCLPTSSSVRLVFFPLSLCLARWFWPDLMNGRHDHTTAVCVSLRSPGDLHAVQLPARSWHGLPRW